MKLSHIGVTLTLAAAVVGASSHAGDHRRESKDRRQAAVGMQAIAVSARPGEPGHGWQYFSDARKARAVVISPSGDYYLSQGEGLQLVFRRSAAT